MEIALGTLWVTTVGALCVARWYAHKYSELQDKLNKLEEIASDHPAYGVEAHSLVEHFKLLHNANNNQLDINENLAKQNQKLTKLLDDRDLKIIELKEEIRGHLGISDGK